MKSCIYLVELLNCKIEKNVIMMQYNNVNNVENSEKRKFLIETY